MIRSLISLFQKEVACSSEYKWRVSAYCRKPADESVASVLSEGNGNNGKKPLMCCANPATESPLLSHLNRVFASRADRLYLMMMRRASLPFLSRFHSRSELRTDARSSPFPVQPRNPCDCALPVVTSRKAWKYDSLAFWPYSLWCWHYLHLAKCELMAIKECLETNYYGIPLKNEVQYLEIACW